MADSGRIGVADRAGGPTDPSPTVSATGAHPLRNPALFALEVSAKEMLIDDVTHVIQRAPYICRAPKRLFTPGLTAELAAAIDRLNVKLAELQDAGR